MPGLIHKYMRRLVVWAQTPSEEEVEARDEHFRQIRRKRLAKLIPISLRDGVYFSSWVGLSRDERDDLIADAKSYGEQNSITVERRDIAALQHLILSDGKRTRESA